MRGWQVTHDRRFLEPYTRASLTRDQALKDLVEVESDEPKARAVAERIADRSREWVSSVAEPIIAQDPNSWTVQLSLSTFLTAQTVNLHELFTAATISILPLVVVFVVLQRFIVQGFERSGISG